MNIVRINLFSIILIFTSCAKSPHDYAHHRTSCFKNLNEQDFNDTTLVCATFNIQPGFPANKDPWNSSVTGADSLQTGFSIPTISVK